MPAKPIWYSQLDTAIEQIEALPSPWVDRATVESALGVGRRRAQQILQPLVTYVIGSNGLARREDVIRHLRHLAAGDDAHFCAIWRQATMLTSRNSAGNDCTPFCGTSNARPGNGLRFWSRRPTAW